VDNIYFFELVITDSYCTIFYDVGFMRRRMVFGRDARLDTLINPPILALLSDNLHH
jgi:hypothetical protein